MLLTRCRLQTLPTATRDGCALILAAEFALLLLYDKVPAAAASTGAAGVVHGDGKEEGDTSGSDMEVEEEADEKTEASASNQKQPHDSSFYFGAAALDPSNLDCGVDSTVSCFLRWF